MQTTTHDSSDAKSAMAHGSFPKLPANIGPVRSSGAGQAFTVEGIHVLRLKGSFYEMGRQHGALLSQEILRGPLPYYRSFVQKLMGANNPVAPLAVTAMQRLVGGRVQLPDFARQTIAGMAFGSGIPERELLEGATMPDAMLWLVSQLIRLKAPGPAVVHRLALELGCTSALAWGAGTKDGHLLHGRNFDYHGVSCWPSTKAVLFHEPDEGMKYVSVGAAGVAMGGVTAMNDAGLTLTVHQHMFTAQARLGGVAIGTIGDLVMRKAETLKDAERILREHRHIGCWTYLIGSEREQSVLCYEADPKRQVAIRPKANESTFGYANIYLDPELGRTEENLYGSYWRHNHGRFSRTRELLEEGQGKLGPQEIANVMGDPGTGPCRIRNSIAMVLTVGSVVFRPSDGTVWVGGGEAPTSHGEWTAFSLKSMGPAPDAASLSTSHLTTPSARDAFESFRKAYVAYVDNNDVRGTAEHLERAAKAEPDQSVYHATAGIAWLQAGYPQAALAALENAVRLGHPDEERRAGFLLWRGRAHDLMGARRKAEDDYRAALGHRNDRPVAAGALRNLRRPFTRSDARKVHLDMSLGDVVSP